MLPESVGSHATPKVGAPASGDAAAGDAANDASSGAAPTPTEFAELDRLLGAAAVEVDRGLDEGAGRIGRYTLVSPVGEGGFGTVWLASQQQPVRRLVALKVLRRDPGSKMVIARFQNERQALARMDHPNVSAVLDAGVADDGRPWFAMPYIDGLPINAHCDQERLPLRERVRLLAETCDGVHHAHQKGIIHRDLKPGNILVQRGSERGLPKVIDFGVAKALEGGNTATVATQDGQRLGTPQYMPPEQWMHGAAMADVRSDVYALGAVLAELLVGGPPTRLPRTPLESPEVVPPAAWLAQQRTVDPAAAARVAAARGVGLDDLGAAVAGDLDAIVRKATATHPADRYASAASLADDLRRWLEGNPVAARMLAPWERTVRVVRRNRVAAAIAGIAAAALVIAAVMLVQATLAARSQRSAAVAAQDRADRSFELARGMLQDLLTRQMRARDPASSADSFLRAEQLVESIAAQDPIVAARLAAIVGAGHMASWERRAAYELLREHLAAVLVRESEPGAEQAIDDLALPLHRMALAYDRKLAAALAPAVFRRWVDAGQLRSEEARARFSTSLFERTPWPVCAQVSDGRVLDFLAQVHAQLAPSHEESALELASSRLSYFCRAPGDPGALAESEAARQRIMLSDPPESRRRITAELQYSITKSVAGGVSQSDVQDLMFLGDRAALEFGRSHPTTINVFYNLACTCSSVGLYEDGWNAYRSYLWPAYQRQPDGDGLRRWTLGYMAAIAYNACDSDAAYEIARVELWDDERLGQESRDQVQQLAAATLAAVQAERGDEAGARATEAKYGVQRQSVAWRTGR